MTHDKPFIRPAVGDRPATLVWGAREHPMTPNEEILWMGYFIEDLQTHRIVVVPGPVAEVRDE